ncbi:unnamed protein product [Haemonchus placei]|uniref:Uncharacterized protein n=1 Tax=Haemonchus placei TaxID=6290 RepID=A0A0N4X3V2_HAEPC|nr:unnamed protein product [Haemonchus placei]
MLSCCCRLHTNFLMRTDIAEMEWLFVTVESSREGGPELDGMTRKERIEVTELADKGLETYSKRIPFPAMAIFGQMDTVAPQLDGGLIL